MWKCWHFLVFVSGCSLSLDPLASVGHPSWSFVAYRTKFIAWGLRFPIRRMLTGSSYFCIWCAWVSISTYSPLYMAFVILWLGGKPKKYQHGWHFVLIERKKIILKIINVNIIFIIQSVKSCAIPCPHQLPTRSDNTVLVAQSGTATPGATKQLLLPDRVLRELYVYI